MLIVAQAGLGAAGGAIGALVYVFTLSSFALIAFTTAWIYLPAVLRLLWDLIRGHDLLTGSVADRSMDGRLFTTCPVPDKPPSKK